MCPKSQTNPRVVGMMRVRNGEPYLSRALAAAEMLVDAFVILNDGSTDRTAEICKAHPKVAQCVDQSESSVDEVRDKNRLLKMALDLNPDWILALDADEEIEAGGCEFILQAIAETPLHVSIFSFDFPYFWNDEQHVRFDGPYSRHTRHARMFRVQGAAAESLRFEYTGHGSGFHCGSVPQGLAGSTQYLPVKFKHFGYLQPEQRQAKYDFYVAKDPQGARDGYYEHLVREEGMVLLPWQDRADALRAPRPRLPAYYYNLRPEILGFVPTTATRILELGCACGQLGKAVKERQICHLVGVELNPDAAREALKYYDEVQAGDLESKELGFPDQSFDCVVCADILEHLADPWTVLERIARWLTPGGTLVCSIPNLRNFKILKDLSEGSWPYVDAGILDRTHLRFFTRMEFEKLLHRARFTDMTIVAMKDTEMNHQQFPSDKASMDIVVGRLGVKNVTAAEFEELTALQLVFAARKPAASKPRREPLKIPRDASSLAGKRMLATIIIPVYNQAAATLQCLEALSKNTPDHLYNGVIVDNASTDETPELLKGLSGDVRVIRNAENLGFVKACNLGAQAATAKYLLFLNNDTVPVPGWLEAMLSYMENDETIGAVCAKLIYPDGRLQEAGGIIFSDASGWNFGRGDDPSKPEYCRPYEVDYGSGACLLVRKELFQRLGGFDERFAPAYYEDVDLCFGVRRLGYRVVFCPQSAVIHFEGVTAGRNLNTGFKQYQARNQQIFLNKWKAELSRHALPPTVTGQAPLTSDRQRLHALGGEASRKAGPYRILMLDHVLPWYDRAAGSLRTYQTVKLLRRLGHSVSFFARTAEKQDQYRKKLEDLGVTVYPTDKAVLAEMGLPTENGTTLEEILSGQTFDLAWIDFYETACRYLPVFRRLAPDTHLLVDTVDVHFLREQRQAELYQDADLAKRAQETKTKELEIYALADSLVAVTPADQAVLNQHVPKVPVHILPTIHQVEPAVKPFREREGIVFVGTFNHPPNIDAVLFYGRIIHPLVQKLLPGIKVSICGGNPPEVVKKLQGNGIAILGHVPETRPYLESCRISIAPIRFGAGIKGKICEAMSYGLPVVTTPLGAEGLALSDGKDCLIADTPEKFAEAVARLYRDEPLWNSLSANGQSYIAANLSEKAAATMIRGILEQTVGKGPEEQPAPAEAAREHPDKARRVLLVNPHDTEQLGFTNPPLGLLYIAGTLLNHGYEVRVVDGCLDGRAGVEKALREFKPGIVGLTCLTPGRKKVLELAKMAKDLDPFVTVVLGGAHPTIMYKQLMENYFYIDLIVLGEGEQTFLEIAQGKPWPEIKGLVYRSEEGVKKTLPRPGIANLDELPFPAWHLVDLARYQARGNMVFRGIDLTREPRISVIFSRGCKGHCDFCSTWWIWKGWRHRSPKNMADELELLNRRYGIKHFCFADDALTVDRQATIDLCDEILARNLRIAFHATTRTDCVDEVVLQKLHDAGCYQISFGVETGSQALLERMGKRNDIASAEQAIRLAKAAGIRVTALVIIGNVGETPETVAETVRFLQHTDPTDLGCVGGLWILPGTKLYRMSKEKGFIDDDFWLGDEPYKIYTLEWPLAELTRMQNQVMAYKNANPGQAAASAAAAPAASGLMAKWQRYVQAEVNEYSATTEWVDAQGQHIELMAMLPAGCRDVLDLGCGDGWSTHRLRMLGKNAGGVTINPKEAEHARQLYQIQLLVCDMHDLSLPDRSFDAIYCRESYEHTVAPYIALCEMNRVLRMNGHALINLPWEEWIRENSHFSVFTPSQMREMFYKCRFVVEQEGRTRHGHFWYLARKVAEIGEPHPFKPPVPGKPWLNGQVMEHTVPVG